MKTECQCHELPADTCLAERPRYFPRQIITADDLTLEQDYFRNKLRRHNRFLHGWGVVCGALVCPLWKCQDKLLEPWKVVVRPGYILGPCGDEIVIDYPRVVDLRKPNAEEKSTDPCGEPIDPWCSEPCPEETNHGPLYLAVKYKEIRTHPVRVQPIGCGCDDQPCEYSRFCDGYEFGIVKSCPESQQLAPANPNVNWEDQIKEFFKGCNPDCPPCPCDPWVVLARIELGNDGVITSIDNCACRRLVFSAAPFWWKCQCSLKVENGQEAFVLKRRESKQISIKGAKAPIKAYAPGITVALVASDPAADIVTLSVSVNSDAADGEHLVVVSDSNCSTASFSIEVKPEEVLDKTEKTMPAETRKSRRHR